MAAVREPEVQFAQRLAANEKPVRTKAMKKLRKYVHVRSQKATGGFTGDELLKLWKGLFYCLWMQDKPLLQEELSGQIANLLHSFQDAEGQFLYLESFLQTFKREWTGIDRLRMDKFFQLVRFMFRQTFEMLQRRNWESSVVSRLLELLTAQLLQSSGGAPSGLQFHVLDLYMTELAAVGSTELTADQNLVFIEPFCRTAAKTKDRTLFKAICGSIFSAIIDQAPFAIADLMREVQEDEGPASAEDDVEGGTASTAVGQKKTRKQMNGFKSDDEEEDELLHSEESDAEEPWDDDIGPVLQFDYGALAARLFELASRSNTPSHNRQRLYKIVKALRDLSEGVFPQDEYPEEVSTDEDDDMFGSRKRMKRRGRRSEEGEEPASKKSKGKKPEASTPDKQNKDTAKDEPADVKKKKKKKKKAERGGVNAGTAGSEKQAPVLSPVSGSPSETGLLSEKETSEELQPAGEQQVSCEADAVASGKKKKKGLNAEKKLEEVEGGSQLNGVSAEEEEEKPTDSSTPGKTQNVKVEVTPAANVSLKKKKKKKEEEEEEEEGTQQDAALEDSPAADETPPKKKRTQSQEGSKTAEEEDGAQQETPQEAETENLPVSKTAPAKKKKKKKNGSAQLVESDAADVSSGKTQKKRKIPVVFEFEADDALAGEETKKTGLVNDVGESSEGSPSDFVTFQSNAAVPTPLFCRARGSPRSPLCGKKKSKKTPGSESKKVTFGLKNNKTAEFKKTDRSLLVSPDGSSRVPFDPKQKPKFGVLKSPVTPLSAKVRKTPRKTPSRLKGTPKGRPTAADFF